MHGSTADGPVSLFCVSLAAQARQWLRECVCVDRQLAPCLSGEIIFPNV